MNVTIRWAAEDDAEALFILVADFATSFVPGRPSFEISLREIIPSDAANLSIAEVDGEIVDYCLGFDHSTFFANGRVSWVEEITVQESFRRNGIGKALMDSFKEWGAGRGAKLAALATRRAASFYISIGYEESATFYRKLL